jgi:hypothetical protein
VLRLTAPQVGVCTVRPNQARVLTALDDPAPIEHQDLVRGRDAGQPVRDDDGRGAVRHGREIGLDGLFGRAVERRGRLVEDEDARALQDGAGNRKTLLLATGELEPALADQGCVAVRQGVDEALQRGGGGRGIHLRRARIRAGERDVLADHVVEQDRLLRHHGDWLGTAALGRKA